MLFSCSVSYRASASAPLFRQFLGYIPGIAALTVGMLSPIATVFIVLLTIFGVRPINHWVAAESPHGRGSISMLERLLSFWKGKLFVLALLGFIATDYMITITLSDSDAATHLAANPFAPGFLKGQEVAITLFLVALLGTVFLKGFREAIWISVFLVGACLLLNLVVVFVGFYEIFTIAVVGAVDPLLRASASRVDGLRSGGVRYGTVRPST
jgi:hypothetical protein